MSPDNKFHPAALCIPTTLRTSAIAIINLELGQPDIIHRPLAARSAEQKECGATAPLTLHAVDRYLRSQSAWLVNYAERHRAGLRVGTSLTEGAANFLVNKRMAKSQQMRWSRHGADLLL